MGRFDCIYNNRLNLLPKMTRAYVELGDENWQKPIFVSK
jgi:hypothetical protein